MFGACGYRCCFCVVEEAQNPIHLPWMRMGKTATHLPQMRLAGTRIRLPQMRFAHTPIHSP